jgi:hypothetical protein
MYETFMNTVRRFFTPEGFFGFVGGGFSPDKLKWLMLAVFGAAVLSLVVWTVPAYRKWHAGKVARGGWSAIAVSVPAGLVKLLLLFMVARFLTEAMVYQAREFKHEHGRVTTRNRSAVLSKWGKPHEQRELKVNFTRKRTWVTRQLKVPGEDGYVTSDSFWKDKAKPVQAVDGKMPLVLTTHEEERDVAVEQRTIQSADVEITVHDNPRELGGANYAGYDDAWRLKYIVANEQKEFVTAHFVFPRTYDMDNVHVKAAGQDMLDKLKSVESALAWDMEIAPGKPVTVEIGYDARGLEHLRYIPRRAVPTAHYRVAIHIKGIPGRELDFPIGSMPTERKLADIEESDFTLAWSLDNAITQLDIGIKLPTARQPQYHVANLLNEAPTGLVLLLVLLVVPRLMTGRPLSPLVVGILAVAYYLFFTFLGRLADLPIPFTTAFLIAVVALQTLVVFFRGRGAGTAFLRIQDSVVFGVLVVLYPLAVIGESTTEFWMQLLYMATLFYICALAVGLRREEMPGK